MTSLVKKAKEVLASATSAISGSWDGSNNPSRANSVEDVSKEMSTQFRVDEVFRGELFTRTEDMKMCSEYFRYRVEKPDGEGRNSIRLELWYMAPLENLLARIRFIAELFTIPVTLGSRTLNIHVLVLREDYDTSLVPGCLETGAGPGWTVGKKEWEYYLTFRGQEMTGHQADLRLLYAMVVNRDTMGSITLDQFAALAPETIIQIMEAAIYGIVYRKPSRGEAGMRSYQLIGEQEVNIVSDDSSSEEEEDEDEDSESGSELDEDTGESSSDYGDEDESFSLSLGQSPSLSTTGMELGGKHHLSTSTPPAPRSAKRMLTSWEDESLANSMRAEKEGLEATSRMIGRLFISAIRPGASRKEIDQEIAYLMSPLTTGSQKKNRSRESNKADQTSGSGPGGWSCRVEEGSRIFPRINAVITRSATLDIGLEESTDREAGCSGGTKKVRETWPWSTGRNHARLACSDVSMEDLSLMPGPVVDLNEERRGILQEALNQAGGHEAVQQGLNMCFASTGVRDLDFNSATGGLDQGTLGLFGDPFLSKLEDQREVRTVSTEESGDDNYLGIGVEDNIGAEVLQFDLLGGQMSLNGTDESL